MPEALAKKPKLEVGNDSSPQLGQSTHEQENKLVSLLIIIYHCHSLLTLVYT